ncbi:DUF397 domain-containing protein [Amycolatopsis vancoresmycina]|uniref:DUF397 domain-containing protein n=1 Tax=Amycolatopsis vancoresmycina TaxID=208444 RepID=UPI0005265389|nr:DUF397 domain-containing protein [Amycolatopsis vancoresmycina]
MIVPIRTDRNWRISSHSAQDNQCVEVALDTPAVGLRDSKARAAGELDVPAASWAALLEQIR